MTGQPPAPTGSSHKVAAMALVIVCVAVSYVIYNAVNPSFESTRQCIASGNSRCGLPTWAGGLIGLTLFFGFGAAARAWKGK
ncbi:MAG: hypothetical protein ABJB66_15495 [Gemmatimonadaceae bacterium]